MTPSQLCEQLPAKSQLQPIELLRSAPSDEAATKLMYLALRDITAEWTKPPASWVPAANQFAIQMP